MSHLQQQEAKMINKTKAHTSSHRSLDTGGAERMASIMPIRLQVNSVFWIGYYSRGPLMGN
jgi:hypothetical protein